MKNTDLEAVEFLKKARQTLIQEIEKVIVGQHEVIDQLLITSSLFLVIEASWMYLWQGARVEDLVGEVR